MAQPKPHSPLRGNDQLIVEALREEQRPMSAYDLIERLRGQGISAPTTVYRALNRLMKQGLVHRLESLNAFVCCVGDCRHTTAIFTICDRCGAVQEFSDPAVSARLSNRTHAAGFQVSRTTIELRGRCQSCEQASPSADN